MSDYATQIDLTPEAQAIVRDFADQKWLLQAMQSTLTAQMELTADHVRVARLTGKGPFPVSEHRLGERTYRLRPSMRASRATVEGETVSSSIGSNVKYAAAHEFGAHVVRAHRQGTVRLRTDARGNLVRNARGGAVFAKLSHRRATERDFYGGGAEFDIPPRAPVTHGILDRLEPMADALSLAVVNAFHARGNS